MHWMDHSNVHIFILVCSLPMYCRPGMTRLSFPYFMSRDTVNYVIKAVAMVAKHGWKLLPQVIGAKSQQ